VVYHAAVDVTGAAVVGGEDEDEDLGMASVAVAVVGERKD
jgi:hypothetical protein